jgi:hypothetical protein
LFVVTKSYAASSRNRCAGGFASFICRGFE